MPTTQSHIDNPAADLKSWLKVVKTELIALFSATKDAEVMARYTLGLGRQRTALDPRKEWVGDYERSMK